MYGYFQYPVSGRISGKSNPVSGWIPDIKKGRISGAYIVVKGTYLRKIKNTGTYQNVYDCLF
jgi:hypothetical protein